MCYGSSQGPSSLAWLVEGLLCLPNLEEGASLRSSSQQTAGFPQRKQPQSHDLCLLVLEVASNHFRHILSIKSEPLGSTHAQEHECQEKGWSEAITGAACQTYWIRNSAVGVRTSVITRSPSDRCMLNLKSTGLGSRSKVLCWFLSRTLPKFYSHNPCIHL